MPVHENKCKRVKRADDPKRCQALSGKNQCWYEAAYNGYCPIHSSANKAKKAEAEARLDQYRVAQYRARIADLATNPKVKSLRDEIAILRMTLEAILQKSTDAQSLFMNSSRIGDIAVRIEKLVASCHNLEVKSGMLLDKTAVVNLAEQLVQAITAFVDDPDVLTSVSDAIQKVILDNIITE
jgi:hypothetical protein